jgi:hypothetical protein
MNVAPEVCAHNGRPLVIQRTDYDCMTCALGMFAGRTYDEVTSAAQAIFPSYEPGTLMTHSLLRRIAHGWGMTLLSSIYMDWRRPGIVGVISKKIENCGHALFWDGERLINPGADAEYDLEYVYANAIEFTQRATDLVAVIELERQMEPATAAVSLEEFF